MAVLKRVRDFIVVLDRRQFYRYLAIAIGIFLILLGIVGYIHYRKIGTLERKLRRINQQRDEARTILQEHAMVKQQQADVDSILEKDRDFRLVKYFLSLVDQLSLRQNLTQDPIPMSEDLNNGYTEVRIPATFTNLNMKQVVELLQEIDKNDRVYTKELSLIKSSKSPTLDVTLIIATLQPKATTE
ncbi:MAG TPA: hypothetical protein VHA52_04210 [Candidatus Babeliaceae bacterium]|nr:hypothetical protein [Candidatus Babeliaceae bacterium]